MLKSFRQSTLSPWDPAPAEVPCVPCGAGTARLWCPWATAQKWSHPATSAGIQQEQCEPVLQDKLMGLVKWQVFCWTVTIWRSMSPSQIQGKEIFFSCHSTLCNPKRNSHLGFFPFYFLWKHSACDSTEHTPAVWQTDTWQNPQVCTALPHVFITTTALNRETLFNLIPKKLLLNFRQVSSSGKISPKESSFLFTSQRIDKHLELMGIKLSLKD